MFRKRINPGLTLALLTGIMVFESGSLNATIALAAGGDNALFLELRQAFIESARQQLDLMQRSRCDGNWHVAATRLKGIAASFHAKSLIDLANAALEGAPGDPVVLRQIKAFLDQFAAA